MGNDKGHALGHSSRASEAARQSGLTAADLSPGKQTLVQDLIPRPDARVPAGPAVTPLHDNAVAAPEAGIDKVGFVDNSRGAGIYTAPVESGGQLIQEAPLPPTARVFVSGTHPQHRNWWYVTSYVDGASVRGYVEGFRINTDLPEPLAELRELHGGETPEGLAKEKFTEGVRDGHDLRYYENVLLFVNKGRAGIAGTYQEPGLSGSNNIHLFAGHRIWLVSPEYASALEGVVPSGSLTGGRVGKVRRFAGHLVDILASVTESRHHLDEVAGEFAQALRDHIAPIVGLTAAFITAEASSLFLAASPTGVSQAVAVVIQLALSAFGATGMVEGGLEALTHGSAWLNSAWTARGKEDEVLEASKEFLRMLVAIAMAALGYLGAKGNYGNAVQIASRTPSAGLPALVSAAIPRANVEAVAGAGASLGPRVGAFGAAGNVTLHISDREKAALGEGPDVDGLREKTAREARAEELHDKRAAEGPALENGPDAGPARPNIKSRRRPRRELARHIPPRGRAFNQWFDELTLEELDKLLAETNTDTEIGARQVIANNIRHPGGEHEWLMVAEVRQFKKWGVTMEQIQAGRSLTEETLGKRFLHGSAGSGAMHGALRAMTRSATSYADFLRKLNLWADRELAPNYSRRFPFGAPLGRYSLPDNLQLWSN